MTRGEFEPFCERHQSGMFYVAKSVLRDETAAEDAVQIALSRIFEAFGRLTFQTEWHERAYALRAAQNAAIDLRKKESRFEALTEETLTAASVRQGDTVLGAVIAAETEQALADVVGSLSLKAQAIFKYRQLGIQDAEIAATLGITVSDLRTTVFRARGKVEKYLREEGLQFE